MQIISLLAAMDTCTVIWLSRITNISISKLGRHWFRLWFIVALPIPYKRTPNQNTTTFMQTFLWKRYLRNGYQIVSTSMRRVIIKMKTPLFWPISVPPYGVFRLQWVNIAGIFTFTVALWWTIKCLTFPLMPLWKTIIYITVIHVS